MQRLSDALDSIMRDSDRYPLSVDLSRALSPSPSPSPNPNQVHALRRPERQGEPMRTGDDLHHLVTLTLTWTPTLTLTLTRR